MPPNEPTRTRNELARLRKDLIVTEVGKRERMSNSDIHEFLQGRKQKVSKRSLSNYLSQLRKSGELDYDEKSRTYVPRGSLGRQVFASEREHQLAVEHSKNLLGLSRTNIDITEVRGATEFILKGALSKKIDNLIMHQELEPLLDEHITSGYRNNLQSPISNLRKSLANMVFDWGQQALDELFLLVTVDENGDVLPRFGELENKKAQVETTREQLARLKRGDEEEELVDSLRRVIEQFTDILLEVANRIPMRGECKSCPHLRVGVKKNAS